MVQTRSKYRLLQNNQSASISEELTQRQLSIPHAVKGKRKRNAVDNDEDARTIPIAITTTDYSAKHSTNNSDIIQSTAEASMLTPSHDQNENN
ncbi:unnamed protein product, partial [Rotaria magnacalcarata]